MGKHSVLWHLSMSLGLLQLACTPLRSSDAASADLGPAAVDLAARPQPGRYLGFSKPSTLDIRIPTAIDLIQVDDLGDSLLYRAVIRLHFGTADSAAYTSVYFSQLTWHKEARTLAWHGGPEGINVRTAGASAEVFSGTLEVGKASAQFQVATAGAKVPDFFSSLPIIPGVTGTYQGECAGQTTILQLVASRWHERHSEPLSALQVSGRLASAGGAGCALKKPCLKGLFGSGQADPLTASIALKSPREALDCTVANGQLVCGACSLGRVVDGDPSPQASDAPVARVDLLTPPTMAARPGQAHLGGQYYGYLHHERSGRYQLLALSIQSGLLAQDAVLTPGPATLKVAGAATLYFGNGDSSESIAYLFDGRPWRTGPLLLDGDGEAFAVVDTWHDDRAIGVWFSKTYGRIGRFELAAGEVPELSPLLPRLNRISGAYLGAGWAFEVTTAASLTPNERAFYPLKIGGWAQELADQSRRRTIREGSYDFYTGQLALRLDDGRTATGYVSADGIQLSWPAKAKLGEQLTGKTALYQPIGPIF